jgi:hypothetical protein
MVHIGDADYTPITGCAAEAGASRRGLLLVREGGEQLMPWLDVGAFWHHYASGTQVGGAPAIPDSARERASDGSSLSATGTVRP